MITSAGVVSTLQGRGVPVTSVEFISDPWDHIVEWVGRNDRGTAIVHGTVTARCQWTVDRIDVVFAVGEADPL